MASINWLTTSGGVNMAATININTTAYRRLLANVSAITMPMRFNNTNNTGNKKQKPKASVSPMTMDRYSLTFASNWIGMELGPPIDSKPRKNFHAIGNTM